MFKKLNCLIITDGLKSKVNWENFSLLLMSYWADFFKNTIYRYWVNEFWTNCHLMCVSFLLIVFWRLVTCGRYSLNSAKEKIVVNLNSNIFSVRRQFVDISWYCLYYLLLWFWSPHRWWAFKLNSTHYCIWQLIWPFPPTFCIIICIVLVAIPACLESGPTYFILTYCNQ